MIASQCPKCKSIGCNNNNSICNNWNDVITWSGSSTTIKTESNLYEPPKIAGKESKTDCLKQKIKELQKYGEYYSGIIEDEYGEYILLEDVLKLLGE